MQMTAVATAAKAETPKADPTLLDDNVDGVMFRFALEYRNQISPALWLKETLAICGGSKKPEPAQQQQSQLFIEPTLNVGTYAFFHELCDAGFVMTRVSPQEWVDKRRGPCFAVRFIFNRTPLQYAVEPTLQIVIGRYGMPALIELSKKSAWRTSVYRNALRTEGRFGISVNCANSTPFNKLPRGPAKYLRLLDSRIVLE